MLQRECNYSWHGSHLTFHLYDTGKIDFAENQGCFLEKRQN